MDRNPLLTPYAPPAPSPARGLTLVGVALAASAATGLLFGLVAGWGLSGRAAVMLTIAAIVLPGFLTFGAGRWLRVRHPAFAAAIGFLAGIVATWGYLAGRVWQLYSFEHFVVAPWSLVSNLQQAQSNLVIVNRITGEERAGGRNDYGMIAAAALSVAVFGPLLSAIVAGIGTHFSRPTCRGCGRLLRKLEEKTFAAGSWGDGLRDRIAYRIEQGDLGVLESLRPSENQEERLFRFALLGCECGHQVPLLELRDWYIDQSTGKPQEVSFRVLPLGYPAPALLTRAGFAAGSDQPSATKAS